MRFLSELRSEVRDIDRSVDELVPPVLAAARRVAWVLMGVLVLVGAMGVWLR